MSQFIDNEIEKIVKNTDYPAPLNYVMAAAWIAAQFKGYAIKILDVRGICSFSDYFILCTVENPVQGESLVNEVSSQLKKYKRSIFTKEGSSESDWVLLDARDFIVHIFLESSRGAYNLDEVWGKAKAVSIPENFYMPVAKDDKKGGPSGNFEGFF